MVKKSLEKLAKLGIAIAGLVLIADFCLYSLKENKTLPPKQEIELADRKVGYIQIKNMQEAYKKGLEKGDLVFFKNNEHQKKGMIYSGKSLTGEPLFDYTGEKHTSIQLQKQGYNPFEFLTKNKENPEK